MAQEVQELAVRITPEGISDTSDQLEDMQGTFEESAESAGESAGMLDDFAEQFQGAAGVVVAGLSVAAAGLLTQIPVISEVASGLFAILDAILFKIDSQLRPALQPLTDLLFRVADAIFQAEGAVGSAIGTIGAFVTVLGTVQAAIFGLNTVAGTAIPSVVALLTGPLGLAIALIATAIGVFATAWADNWGNIRSNTAKEVAFVESILAGLFDFFSTLWTAAITGFNFVFDAITTGAMDFANTVHGIVVNLVNGVIGLINRAIAAIENLINQAARAASRIPGVNIGSVSLGRVQQLDRGPLFDRQARRRRGRGGGGGDSETQAQIDRLVAALQNNQQTFTVNIDGKQAARQTEPFLGEKTGDQGRSNPL